MLKQLSDGLWFVAVLDNMHSRIKKNLSTLSATNTFLSLH